MTYDQAFFANRSRYHHRIKRAVDALLRVIPHPSSAVDIGCGDGHWLRCLLERNVPSILGIEGTPACLPYTDPVPTLIHDLTNPLHLTLPFELVLCIEVGEHLPETAAPTLADTCAQLLKPGHPLIFTAAPPGQSGIAHINLQPKEYWKDLFIERNLEPTDHIHLQELWQEADVMSWLPDNLMMFVRHT